MARESKGKSNTISDGSDVVFEDVELPKHVMDALKDKPKKVEKNCGTGAGGFAPGNTCGGSGGSEGSGSSLSSPSKHSVSLPSNPRRVTVDQFRNALSGMGYKIESERVENPNSMTDRRQLYTVTDSSGNKQELDSHELLTRIYASSDDPKTSKIKPVRRRRKSIDCVSDDPIEGWFDVACSCGISHGKSVRASDLWTKSAASEFDDITKDESRIARSVDKVLRKQVDAVVKRINASSFPTEDLTKEVETLLKSAKWDREIVAALRPYLERSLQSGITLGIDTVKSLVSSAPDFAPVQSNLDAYVKSESVRLSRGIARGVNRTTAVKVTKMMGEGINAGETTDQLAARVQEWAGEKGDAERSTRARALTIARTEANRATRKAETEAWKSTGLVEGKTWLLAPDPCEFCEAAAEQFGEQSVGINDAFYEKGAVLTGADGGEITLDYEAIDGPPLHPNCRCSMQPRLVDDYEDIVKEMEAEAAKQGAWTDEGTED